MCLDEQVGRRIGVRRTDITLLRYVLYPDIDLILCRCVGHHSRTDSYQVHSALRLIFIFSL